jgi:hypothetical protein
MTMYQNDMAARAAATGTGMGTRGRTGPGSRSTGSETPVFDKLLTDFKDGFRTVPGEPWTPHPAPRFAELGSAGDRLQLPAGPAGF